MAAARKAIRARQAGNQVIVVVSARGDTTDDLIELAREITDQPPAREMDMLLSTGEQISIALLAMAIATLGEPAISFTGAQIGIVTDSTHTKARIKSISTARMRRALADGQIVIVAAFQGIAEGDNITPPGRGGSDTTAAALAALLTHDARAALSGVPDRPGISPRIFAAIADRNIVLDMIAQNAGRDGRAAIGFTVLGDELPDTLDVLRPLAAELGATVECDEEVSKLSVV